LIHVIWQYRVNPEHATAFEKAYGPGEAWAELFAKSAGYHGTILLRDQSQSDPGTLHTLHYVTIDRWLDAKSHDNFHTAFAEAYAALDTRCAPLTVSETRIGVFNALPFNV